MIKPNLKEFKNLASEYDIIPVYKEILADMDTPVSALARFLDRENVFLLESMEGGEKWGRYSFIGIDPLPFLTVNHTQGANGQLQNIRKIYRNKKVAPVPGLPRFFGGIVGFLGYEAVCEFEKMPLPKPSRDIQPCSKFVRTDKLIVFDNLRHTILIIVCVNTKPDEECTTINSYEEAMKAIEEIESKFSLPIPKPEKKYKGNIQFASNMTPEEFKEIVRKAKKYIYQGDIIQVVLSQRFSTEYTGSKLALYRALRLLNPSPYTFFLKIGEMTLIGSSPEVMVRLNGNIIELRPIAGTRPRGTTEQEDRRLADELLSDEKEKAEHVMLVDLGRNDVGRVAIYGSVQVTEYMIIERYSHVMHLVSNVRGILREDKDTFDVISATFPAGTLTGAPKIRAMEIIHELEPTPRGVYGGAVGYIGYNGNMDLAITIRTLEVYDSKIAVQAGAGIVYDSDPQREFEETCHKAFALQKAAMLAMNGLEIE